MEQDLRYPIGKKVPIENPTEAQRRDFIAAIADTPSRLAAAVADLTPAQLDTPYRPGGWTVRQVAHHLADSHMNGYGRFKLALTEDEPTIKPYDEARWAELPDSKLSIDVSLAIIENLHTRWVVFLRALAPADFARKFTHPAIGKLSLDDYLQEYAWHGRHHVAHITLLRERNGWR